MTTGPATLRKRRALDILPILAIFIAHFSDGWHSKAFSEDRALAAAILGDDLTRVKSKC